MKVPDKFPDGCEFYASFSGDDYVQFPDGSLFKLDDSGDELMPRDDLPRSGAAPMSESSFLGSAAGCRAFTKSNAAQ